MKAGGAGGEGGEGLQAAITAKGDQIRALKVCHDVVMV
jgi:hypothetical protein